MRRRIAEHADPAIRDARSDFIRNMVDRQVPMPVTDIEDAYSRPRSALIRDPDPKVRAALARAWRERPMKVQKQLLDDPDPIVRAAATLEKHPGVPSERLERCLADTATRANVARYTPLTADQIRADAEPGSVGAVDTDRQGLHRFRELEEAVGRRVDQACRAVVIGGCHYRLWHGCIGDDGDDCGIPN